MRIVVEPPMSAWRIRPRDGGQPVVATGHQAWLWHPGILAKDIAMAAAAKRLGGRMLHLVVDHDVHDTMHVTLPVRRGDALSTETVRLADTAADVPTGCQPPADWEDALARLRAARDRLGDALACDVSLLMRAIDAARRECHSLAEQVASITVELMRPHVGKGGEIPVAYTGRLLTQIDAAALVQRMIGDARRCVAAYNAAVAANPQAGVAPLSVEPERVELPLWQLGWMRPRRRVFVDLAVPEDPLLVDEAGEPIPEAERALAPKALSLTAIMRSRFCDLFIHGTGGGVYDRAMEAWWTGWTGESAETLAPMAVVTADVHLDFAAPVADREELVRAVWFRHHLPHNIDRMLHVDGSLRAEKHAILDHMDDDRDKARRRRAFARLHAINGELVARHADAVAEADERLRRAKLGLRNAAVAKKRDWCFALYPPAKLAELREGLEREAAGLSSPAAWS